MARRLAWGDAQSLAGGTIEFFPDESGVPVALRVIDVRMRSSTPQMLQYRMLFRGPAMPLYGQRTYLFRHASLGDYAFFITPVRAAADGAEYEACFAHAP